MKVAILAGGKGTRIAELTHSKPKPLIEIGGKPILWHIMMYYSHYGLRDFLIALGYKGEVIREYIVDDAVPDRRAAQRVNTVNADIQDRIQAEFCIDLIDTGVNTETGGRIKRLAPYVENGTFMMTWCDGLSNVNLDNLLAFHKSHGKLATVTAVHPPPRFGHLKLDGDRVIEFSEKPVLSDVWINGAFFVLEPGVFDYIDDDDTQWEREPLERLASDRQLMAFRHVSFWQCMDTLQDQRLLEEIWQSGKAPWKIWE